MVVTTAAVPGRRAPILIDDQTLSGMRPGAVIVDLAAATGGNTTRTAADETVDAGGVVIIGATDLAAGVAADASRMYARNIAAFVDLLAGPDGEYAPDWSDDILADSCICRDGRLVHPRLRTDTEEMP